MMTMQKTCAVMVMVFVLMMGIAYAQSPLPVLYGQALVDGAPADGAVVKVYPQANPSDFITDTVGTAGTTGLSGYWKVVLNNLQTELSNGDVVVIAVTDGVRSAQKVQTIDTSLGTYEITLNLVSAGDAPDSGGSSGSGGSGGGGGGGGSGTFLTVFQNGGSCVPNWECPAFGACIDGVQVRTCTDSNACGVETDRPQEQRACSGGSSGSGAVEIDDDSAGAQPTPNGTPQFTPPASGAGNGLGGITGAAIFGGGAGSWWAIVLLILLVAAILAFVFRKKIKKWFN